MDELTDSAAQDPETRQHYDMVIKVRHPSTLWPYRSNPHPVLVFQDITHALDFMASCGVSDDESMSRVQLFTSHEGLVLDFEESMTRKVSTVSSRAPNDEMLCSCEVFVGWRCVVQPWCSLYLDWRPNTAT